MDNPEAKVDTHARKGRSKFRGARRGGGGGGANWRNTDNWRDGRLATTDTSQQARETHQAEQTTNPNIPVEETFESRRTKPARQAQPAQPAHVHPVEHVQPAGHTQPTEQAQPAEQGGKAATKKKNIQALERQHAELAAILEDRKKHLDSLIEDITLASAKLESLRDANEQHAKKEDELTEKERELAQREQEITNKKAVADLKITQYKRYRQTLALTVAEPNILDFIDNLTERYYELLQHQVRKTEEEHKELLATGDLYSSLLTQSKTLTEENEQLRAGLQSAKDNTSQ